LPKRIVSFCLYGQAPIYQVGALRNLELQKRLYPDFSSRFYVSQEVPRRIVDLLTEGGAEVVCMERREHSDGMFWRFLPAAEPDLDALIVRDTDSRLSPREERAVRAWLASGKGVHIMRDHPMHWTRMLGGAWGCRGSVLPDMARLVEQWRWSKQHGSDQKFLAHFVYPLIAHDVLIHSELLRFEDEQVSAFPSRREAVDEHEQPDAQPEEYRRELVGGSLNVIRVPRRQKLYAPLYRLARRVERAVSERGSAVR
jgi:hypothetical protein